MNTLNEQRGVATPLNTSRADKMWQIQKSIQLLIFR
jgi:hypothetical protein